MKILNLLTALFALLSIFPLAAQMPVRVTDQITEIELPLMGLRVRNTSLTLSPAGSLRERQPPTLPIVTAVLEHGPAYEAGIVPGDIIYKIGRWPSLPVEGLRQTIAQYYRAEADMDVWLYYRFAGVGPPKCLGFTPGLCSLEATVHLRQFSSSRWIQTVPVHDGPNVSPWGGRRSLPGFADAQVEAKNSYHDLLKKDLEFLAGNGCQTTDADLQRMIAAVKNVSVSAGLGDQGDDYLLANTRASACSNARTGGLPLFEGALYAMTDARRLDPCRFDRNADYSSVLNNADYAQFQNRPSYDDGALRRFENYIGHRADQTQKACFLDLIQAEISNTHGKSSPVR